ncbi:MAG: glycoside hydrolase family 15 protein, partial [Pseudolabrys sp.]
DFIVKAGDTVPFTMTYGRSFHPVPPPQDPQQMLTATEKFWRDWAAKCWIGGPWAAQVKRSLITLKALTFAETGGIVAAATTALPEEIGGVRNWDYRFCWVRDATLTLLALLNAGYFEEARDWREWLVRAAAGTPGDLQIMYSVTGRRRLTEWEVPWLPGYEQSRPVRIGNAAHSQIQLDVYGELMDTLHHARLNGLDLSDSGWSLQKAVLMRLEKIWREPDSGIWEARGPARHFTHSKIMAWVAFDRAIATAQRFNLEGPVQHWAAIREAIRADVCANGVDADGAFVRSYGATDMDASLLQVPMVGFLPPDDARVQATVRRIEKTLLVDGLVRRYDTARGNDGLDGSEGVFIACSFWLVDAYVLMGRREEALRLFEHLLLLCNDVGLLSEEYDPVARRQLGNFPQALSHIALMNSAFNLSQAQKPARQRATATA